MKEVYFYKTLRQVKIHKNNTKVKPAVNSLYRNQRLNNVVHITTLHDINTLPLVSFFFFLRGLKMALSISNPLWSLKR